MAADEAEIEAEAAVEIDKLSDAAAANDANVEPASEAATEVIDEVVATEEAEEAAATEAIEEIVEAVAADEAAEEADAADAIEEIVETVAADEAARRGQGCRAGRGDRPGDHGGQHQGLTSIGHTSERPAGPRRVVVIPGRPRAKTLTGDGASMPADMDRFDKFTDRARKVLTLAQDEAQRFNHNYIGTEHLLLGLVREGEGVAARVLENMNVELAKVRTAVEFIIGRGDRPVVGEVGLTPRAKRVIELAIDEARRLGHNYIGTEHLLLGLVREGEGIAAGVLESLGVNLDKVRHEVIRVLSQSSSAGPSAQETKRASKTPDRRPARDQPHGGRPGRQARPGHRPREGDRAGHPDPVAADQEQPCPHRRAGRRQDRHRRGPRPPDRRRRRPRDAAQQARPDARHRVARRRDQVPRRVRGAAQEDHRGAAQHQRRGPLHRRAAHARRGRRGRGRDRRGQHPEAAARPRRAPVHRRDDARRVPQVHRARRGARAPLPAGHGRGADARADRRDPDGHPRALRAAPQGDDQRRGREGRRGPLDALHHRPPPAGQGHRPHRRGRVARPPAPLERAAGPARGPEGPRADHQGEGRGDQQPGVRGSRDAARGRGHRARDRRRAPDRVAVLDVGRPAGRRRGGDRPGRRDVDRHPGDAHRPGGVRAAAPHGGRAAQPGHRPAGGHRDRLEGRPPRPGRPQGPEAARSARSSSSARPASGRPSSPRRSPSSCSAARTR